MKQYGIIGYPLAHSFSEKYFKEKFLREGITGCSYEIYPLKSVQELPALLQQYPELAGLNITIPYKQQVLPYLSDKNHIPAGVEACNCIKIKDEKLIGFNTDTIGFEYALIQQWKPEHSPALVLGNGGAAAAVKYVLQKLNIPFKTVGREIRNGVNITFDGLDEKIMAEYRLIINTTPLGTFPNVQEFPDIPYRYLTPAHFLFDLVYNPATTVFLHYGAEQGAIIQNGYTMLAEQAEESWKIWNSA